MQLTIITDTIQFLLRSTENTGIRVQLLNFVLQNEIFISWEFSNFWLSFCVDIVEMEKQWFHHLIKDSLKWHVSTMYILSWCMVSVDSNIVKKKGDLTVILSVIYKYEIDTNAISGAISRNST